MHLSRGVGACALALAIALPECTSSTSPPTLPECTCASALIYGAEAFYQARPEAAQMIVGLMRHTPVLPSPGGRDYQFHLDDLAVFTGTAATDDLILPLAGQTVLATGKIVEVGYGPELWIDTVCPVD